MHFRKLLFILSMIGCLFLYSSAFALQSGDFTYTVTNNTVAITKYTGSGGAVVIPASINGMPVVTIAGYLDSSEMPNGAFWLRSDVTSVTIPSSVSTIQMFAFAGCTGLTSLTIPNGVITIGDAAFAGCSGITALTIPYSVTTMGARVFYGCTGLTSVTIPGSVTNIGSEVFYSCIGLTSINVDEDNQAYSSLGGVLYNKAMTTLIQFPAGKSGGFTVPGSVTSIGSYAFEHCPSLTSVTIPNSVTSIGSYAFEHCPSLTSVTIPNSVTSIGRYAFYNCTSLTAAYFLGNTPTMGVQVFSNCATGFTVYYHAGATGFTNPWNGYPTAVFTDVDGDGVPDAIDNCPNVYNPLQLDANGNGIGDVCDPTPNCGWGCGQPACEYIDTDGDGIQDYFDNCPNAYNPQQLDANGNGIGDCCDPSPGCGGCGQPACDTVCTL